MVHAVIAATLAAGCRLGFDGAVGDAAIHGEDAADAASDAVETTGKVDAIVAIDAESSVDSPIGVGSYSVSETTAPYVPPANGEPVPGFTVEADDEGFVLALPFPFVFYGITYTEVIASVNGFLTFGAPPTGVETFVNDCPFDGTVPDAVIAVFWDDLYAPDAAPTGSISSAVEGTAPDRQFTVEWRDLDAFYQAGGGNNSFGQGIRATQKVTLHESGAIVMHYGPRTAPTTNRDCGLERHAGCSATVGLEAPGNLLSSAVQCGTMAGPGPGYQPIFDGRQITFVPL